MKIYETANFPGVGEGDLVIYYSFWLGISPRLYASDIHWSHTS